MWNLPNDVIIAYLEGDEGRRLAGRILIHNNQVYVLEDYYGLLAHIVSGPVSQHTITALNSCGRPLNLVSEGSILAGDHLDMVPERQLTTPISYQDVTPEQIQQAQSLPSKGIFQYRRSGMDSDVMLESYANGQCFYDGNLLNQQEVNQVLQNIRNGLATISHAATLPVAKSEFLAKHDGQDDDIEADIQYWRNLHAQNPTPEGERRLKNMIRRYNKDGMMAQHGVDMDNKNARDRYVARNQSNTVMAIDANNFKGINDTYGHLHGDKAIVAYGKALRAAADKVGAVQVFRNGGDEFEAHFGSPEHAHQFARHLREELDQYPHVGGTHKLSLSLGIGENPEHADQALYEAKKQKAGHSLSTIPSVLAHSLHGKKPGIVPTATPNLDKPKPAPAPIPKTSPAPDVNPAPAMKSEDQTLGLLKDLFEKVLEKTEKASLTKAEQIRLMSESMVDFRRSGWEVKPTDKALAELGLEVTGKVEE